MSRRSRVDLLEIVKRKVSMSADISRRDKEYGYYAGASFEIASLIAKIDTMLKHGLIRKEIAPLVKLYRSYLDQQRKAFFASVGSTEITKLGFIQGDTRRIQDATARAT